MFNLIVIPLALLLLAAGLVFWNVQSWRQVRREGEADEVAFGRRQFRRRVQASGLLALVAVSLCVGQLIPAARYPTMYALFWLGVMLLVFWAMLLALGDMAVNRQRLKRFQHQRLLEEAKINAELKRLRNRAATHPEGPAGDGSATA